MTSDLGASGLGNRHAEPCVFLNAYESAALSLNGRLDEARFSLCGNRGLWRRPCLFKIRKNLGADLAGGDRAAEEISLSLVAIGLVEKGRLLGGLDTLDRHPHVQLASERDDRLHHRLGVTTGTVESLHKA